MDYCDLHTHSTYSDGTFSPTKIVAEGLRRKLRAVALTDHNTVAGLSEFLKAAEGTGLEGIPGVEISTGYRNNKMMIANPKVIAFMLAAAMCIDGKQLLYIQ